MRRADLPLVADLHLRELSHGFFPELGPRFLAHYHRTFVDSPHCLATVAGHDATLGFVTATLAPRRHARWVRSHALPRLLAVGAIALLRRPRALWTFLTTRAGRYTAALWQPGRGGDRRRSPRRERAPAVLQHLAVEPAARGHGLGATLTAHVVAAAAAHGAEEVRLITQRDSDATGFYRSQGWEVLRHRHARGGSPVTEFTIATEAV